MSAVILRGNALDLPLADDSVDLIVTSPPYFGLRSYQDSGEHYGGQLGSEATPAEFVDALIAATREMVRVLKPSGSIWVNLGDKYASSATPGPQSQSTTMTGGRHKGVENVSLRRLTSGVPTKSLIGIPWRYALRCIDDLGLILRAEVIWSKPNGLPESVTDRVRRSHEVWFHFTLQPRYYSAVDEIREAHDDNSANRSAARHGGGNPNYGAGRRGDASGKAERYVTGELDAQGVRRGFAERRPNPLGKLPGSVWTIPTEPLTVPAHLGIDHFAAFPTEWPKRIIAGWSPPGVCTACGEGRRPVSSIDYGPPASGGTVGGREGDIMVNRWAAGVTKLDRHTTITGYTCACPDTTAPTTPSVVVDPFGGTGTVALVAHALGRHGISVDMSADYCRLAQWRTTDPAQRAKAAGVDKPPVEVNGQGDLFSTDESRTA